MTLNPSSPAKRSGSGSILYSGMTSPLCHFRASVRNVLNIGGEGGGMLIVSVSYRDEWFTVLIIISFYIYIYI